MDCLYLVQNGVPFDIAFSLPAAERLAWIVAVASLDGRQFDWVTMSWVDE